MIRRSHLQIAFLAMAEFLCSDYIWPRVQQQGVLLDTLDSQCTGDKVDVTCLPCTPETEEPPWGKFSGQIIFCF